MPKLKNIIPIKARCTNLVERQMDGRKDTKKVIVFLACFPTLLKIIIIIAKTKNIIFNT